MVSGIWLDQAQSSQSHGPWVRARAWAEFRELLLGVQLLVRLGPVPTLFSCRDNHACAVFPATTFPDPSGAALVNTLEVFALAASEVWIPDQGPLNMT